MTPFLEDLSFNGSKANTLFILFYYNLLNWLCSFGEANANFSNV